MLKFKVGDVVTGLIDNYHEGEICRIRDWETVEVEYIVKYYQNGKIFESRWIGESNLKLVKSKEDRDFKVGDYVVWKNGTALRKIDVISKQSGKILAFYVDINTHNQNLPSSNRRKHKSEIRYATQEEINAVLDEDISYPVELCNPQTNQGETTMTQKLFQVNGTDDQFGTFLTKNSKGQFVLEMKGKDAEVKAFAEDELTEVKPNYIIFECLNNNSTFNMECSSEIFNIGDILIINGGISIVKTVKSDTPKGNNFKPSDKKKIRRLDPKMFKEVKIS